MNSKNVQNRTKGPEIVYSVPVMRADVNSNSSLSYSTTLNIDSSPIYNIVDELHDKVEVERWDLLFLFYLLSGFFASISIGSSATSEYDYLINCSMYIHFACEMALSWHFIFSSNTARKLSIVTGIIFVGQAIILPPLVNDLETLQSLIGIEFIFSDVLAASSSLGLILNFTNPQELRLAGTVILMHFVGVIITFIIVLKSWYVDDDQSLRGQGWTALGLALIPQVYFSRDILKSKMNHISINTSNKNTHIRQIIIILTPILMFICFRVGRAFRTTEINEDKPLVMAVGIWAHLIQTLGTLIGSSLIVVVLYLWATGRYILLNQKKQQNERETQKDKQKQKQKQRKGSVVVSTAGASSVSTVYEE